MFIGPQGIAQDKRSRDGPDQRGLVSIDDPEDGQGIMAKLFSAFVDRACQHGLKVSHPETLAGAIDGRKELPGRFARVDRCRTLEAIVAIPACLGRTLAKMPQ